MSDTIASPGPSTNTVICVRTWISVPSASLEPRDPVHVPFMVEVCSAKSGAWVLGKGRLRAEPMVGYARGAVLGVLRR